VSESTACWILEADDVVMVDDIIGKNVMFGSLVTTSSTKPSFLLWDKVYQKLGDANEEKWFLRACEAALKHFKTEFGKNELLR